MPLPSLLACQLESGTSYRRPRHGLEAITTYGGLQGLLWRDNRLEEGSSEEGEVARHQQAGSLPALQRQYPVQSLREVRLITPGAPPGMAPQQSDAGCEQRGCRHCCTSCLPISGADWTRVAGLAHANVMCAWRT